MPQGAKAPGIGDPAIGFGGEGTGKGQNVRLGPVWRHIAEQIAGLALGAKGDGNGAHASPHAVHSADGPTWSQKRFQTLTKPFGG